MTACTRCGTEVAGATCPACGQVQVASTAPAAPPPPGTSSAAAPPGAPWPMPAGYAPPWPPTGHPPYGYYGAPAPWPLPPSQSSLAIAAAVFNFLMAALLAIGFAGALSASDDGAPALLIAAIGGVVLGAIIAGAIGLLRSRTWGAVVTIAIHVVMIAGWIVLLIALKRESDPAADEINGGAAIFIIGGLATILTSALAIPNMRPRRRWLDERAAASGLR